MRDLIEFELEVVKIEGNVSGDVRCRTLILGGSGVIKGNVYSERARVSGAVNGSIKSVDLVIDATGMVTGEATYWRLKVAIGGIIEGELKRNGEAEQVPKIADTQPVSNEGGKSVYSQAEKRRPSGLFVGAPTKT